ncbi:MAG: triacylglycerol lipase [Calothrix sp. MO_192.B10]|nr:triacylglycerol lipase [Calothrix sp. MO_192.B10]
MKNGQGRNSVVLVHGIFDTHRVFDRMASYLRKNGWQTHSLDLIPNNGDKGLDELAQQVADYIALNFTPGETLDLVGFSMGGIVSRYYVQKLGGIKRIQRLVNISTPNHGTAIAYFPQNIGGKQMRPRSQFLQDLNQDIGMLKKINYTCIWTPFDLMIVPATSSKMPVGEEVVLPVGLHPWMLTDSRSIKSVATALSTPL